MLYCDARSTSHQDIDVTFDLQVRYRLKNGETVQTGKRRRDVSVERHNKKVVRQMLTFLRLQNLVVL
jgi:hypothetical protein